MRVLAFDTCFQTIDIAVLDGAAITAHVSETVSGGHGERLLPLIETALAKAGLEFADIDRVAVTLGPGGFTGLRVGVAVARAIALSTGKQLVGISSLDLLARTAFARSELQEVATIVATADARKGMLFAQRFQTDPWTPLDEPELLSPDEIAAVASQQGVLIVGQGANAIQSAPKSVRRAAAADLLPDARVLAAAAPHLTPLDEPRPFYVRAADAKPQSGKSLPRA